MNSAWTVEFTRIFFLFVMGLLIGFVFEAWILAASLPGVIYIGWTLIQLRTFEQWIRLGAKTKTAPEFSGIWQLVVRHINRTQRKNKQHKIRLTSLARRFKATIAALPDATIVLNSDMEIEWSNQVSMQLFGIDKKRDLGLRLDNLVKIAELQALLSGEGEQQLEIESPIDRLKTLMITCVDFGEQQKLITARDVTQRVAVQKLRKAFIANASHELRTPLTVISGYLELLESEPELSEGLRKQVINASVQASRMQVILDDMLVLSRLEAKGSYEETDEIVDIATTVKMLVTDFQKSKAQDTHLFEIDIEKGLQLKVNESDIYSLCQNLLSNAVKYSPDGSLIQVKCQLKNEQACIQFSDNGEGIAPEHLSRLTERFYRVSVARSRQVGGTGLGLSIVKHILENHGGYLEIESEPGRGSVFSAYLPESRVIKNHDIEHHTNKLLS
jgi:two-component system, OmpR family, phosphate regulon sensor histidine kinase PhoR